ncbi:polysaccharide pyruvyl transferase family protein [uncultured Ruminococcus sp.]|uniref:polysaccharide pyruvyl transferase family protein n=1 Tax=uncultured Ruminococcus sp. TaxID=165186 RepID=UPI0025E3DE00|nr:polysaccharide pyruvyl transferase family protein [uncultured Ruminococcus sp.]
MKKVAIITITTGQNYGNKLQNYALQKSLQDLHFDVYTLKHKRTSDLFINKSISVAKTIIKIIIKRPYNRIKKNRIKCFKEFGNRSIIFSDYTLSFNNYPKGLTNKYDYFIAGSDQVWNAGFQVINEELKNYLLQFAKPEQRVAYAASFGTDKIAPGYEHYFKEELPKFKAISVREESGVKLVEECGAKATVVLDPTMLLNSDQWKEIARRPDYVEKAPFVVTYFLGGRDAELTAYINRIANGRKIYNLEIESASENTIDSIEVFATAPDEFVWLIANADCVLTDSFHATVFSILFHKPFCVFERKAINESYKMGGRIDTLLGKFHLERFRDSDRSFSVVPEKYEIDEIERVLDVERKKSLDFLISALSD